MTPSALASLLVAAAVVACSSGSSGGGGTTPPTGDAATGDAATGDTWASWGQGFFQTYCVECHGAGNSKNDYTTQAQVVRDRNEIRCGVAAAQDPSWGCAAFPPAKQFPVSDSMGTNPKPSDAERARAVAWLSAGAP